MADAKDESKDAAADSKGDDKAAEAKSEAKGGDDAKAEAKGGEAKGGDAKGDMDIVACWTACGNIVSAMSFRAELGDFVRDNCRAFSADEENKLEYTEIHTR